MARSFAVIYVLFILSVYFQHFLRPAAPIPLDKEDGLDAQAGPAAPHSLDKE